ncbi:MAG TPA: hypothetical protein VM164_14975 [Burkholderiales bacterium]|nr:hypothetical protein [Burkholderiales bacterium]
MNTLAAPLMVACAAGIAWLALTRRARATTVSSGPIFQSGTVRDTVAANLSAAQGRN